MNPKVPTRVSRTRRARQLARAIALLPLALASAWAEPAASSGPPVVYTVGTRELSNHKIQVQAEFPPEAFDGPERTLALPVWTPGSYKVRDYSKSLGEVELLNGQGRASLKKTSKNRWTVVGDFPREQPLKVAYTVYGHELTVRTNYFSPDLSLLIGAATFLAPAPLESGPQDDTIFEVRFDNLKSPINTPLDRLSEDDPTFSAVGYDELVDSPILFGQISEHAFQAGGKPHTLVQAGDTRYWSLPRSLKDAQKVIETAQQFWGVVPYDHYAIMNLVTDTRGGLEHLESTVVMTSRFATEDREKYVEWLGLVCHEYFHTWNVKRLRPKALGPFQYEEEVYTPSLWVAEGITSYYEGLLVRRAGLSTRAEYLKSLSGLLNGLLATPGRKALPLTEASRDAWIRLYQPTDNSINDDVSYYTKGAVVAWLLDTEIRRRSDGVKTLDAVMREAYGAFSKSGYEEADFRALASRVSGSDLESFFRRALDTTEEMPLQDALDYWGLEWAPDDAKVASEPFLGVATPAADGRIVESVAAGSPAARAGLSPGDELVAIDGTRVPVLGPAGILKYLKVGTSYPVLVARLGRVKELQVKLAAQPNPKRALKVKADKGPQNKRLDSWLGPESTVPENAAPSTKGSP